MACSLAFGPGLDFFGESAVEAAAGSLKQSGILKQYRDSKQVAGLLFAAIAISPPEDLLAEDRTEVIEEATEGLVNEIAANLEELKRAQENLARFTLWESLRKAGANLDDEDSIVETLSRLIRAEKNSPLQPGVIDVIRSQAQSLHRIYRLQRTPGALRLENGTIDLRITVDKGSGSSGTIEVYDGKNKLELKLGDRKSSLEKSDVGDALLASVAEVLLRRLSEAQKVDFKVLLEVSDLDIEYRVVYGIRQLLTNKLAGEPRVAFEWADGPGSR